MPVLHCAKCGSTLDIKKRGGIWSVQCHRCNAEITLEGRGTDLFDAYEAYTRAVQEGTVEVTMPQKRRTAKSKGISDSSLTKPRSASGKVQSLDAIREIIEIGGNSLLDLPDDVKNVAESGRDYLVSYRYLPETDTEYGSVIEDLKIPNRLVEILNSKGIERLYSYQEEVFEKIFNGDNVVIAAPTAQGKTEAFVLPIIKSLLVNIQDSFMNPGIRALIIYPTKALARDQYEKIAEMCHASGLTVSIFDGDVSQTQRAKIYNRPPDLLLTNPDVLHYHLGWSQSRLVSLLSNVKYVVLDEIHLYTGSMGSNVYYILKRLRAECGAFQMIGASATIANPKEFAEMLFDSPVDLVLSESAKRGPIHFMMYYPGNRSKYSMIVDLVAQLRRGGFKTLVFGNTHSEAELLNIMLNDIGVKSKIHRAGLSKKHRSEVEAQFKSGQLSVLVSTPTLELGIDIGDLDSVVSMIVSITRLTQRIGRAGRKGQESVAVLALREKDPISSFYRHKPEKYFTDVDAAYMEPDNEVVGYYQLIAAAMSGKLNLSMFPRQRKIISRLEEDGLVEVQENGAVRVVDFDRAQKAWRGYSIRGIGDTVQIKLGKKSLGERSMPMAAQELHPGAIYLHGGANYLSVDFQYTVGFGRATVVSLNDRSAHTRPLYFTMPKIIEIHEERKILGMNVIYCTLEMAQTVFGFVKKETRTGRILGRQDIPRPLEYRYETRGIAFMAPEPINSINDYIDGKMNHLKGPLLGPADLYGGAYHALEHVIIESSDMLTGGGTREIGGVSMGDSGIIFVYDGSPGGNGASRLLFSRFPEAFERAEIILDKCECNTSDGCPLCTYSYQCGNNNSPLYKIGALESIRLILKNAETSVDTKSYSGFEPVV